MEITNLDNPTALVLRMTDGYGIATNYRVANACPYDGSELVMKTPLSGCYDGEFTHVDQFTCQNGCTIQYRDMRQANGYHE